MCILKHIIEIVFIKFMEVHLKHKITNIVEWIHFDCDSISHSIFRRIIWDYENYENYENYGEFHRIETDRYVSLCYEMRRILLHSDDHFI